MAEARRVLLVEDDASVGEVVHDILAEEGFEIRWAVHGRAALDLLDAWVPDVIVLDLMMPVMDGREFRTRQRQITGPIAHVPVIVLSGMRDAHAAGIDLEAAATLTKPFDLEVLLTTIFQVLGDKKASG